MREAGVESRLVDTSENGKGNFVETVVIKKLTPAIIVHCRDCLTIIQIILLTANIIMMHF